MPLQITILGSSSALPSPSRFSTAHLVNISERFFLVDCGEGTQIQMARFRVPVARINHIFITHLHGDHIFGLFGLLSSYSLLQRKEPLHLHTQEAHRKMIDAVFEHLELSYPIEYHFYDPTKVSEVYRDKVLTITAFPVVHRAPTVGFVFRELERPRNIKKSAIEQFQLGVKDIVRIKEGEDYITPDGNRILNRNLTTDPSPARSYAFVTDTLYTEDILPYIQGVDVLYHEATYAHDMVRLARLTKHTTAYQAGVLARKAGVQKLIIGHFSQRYKQVEGLLREACIEFPNTELAFDGKRIELS